MDASVKYKESNKLTARPNIGYRHESTFSSGHIYTAIINSLLAISSITAG